jgi:MFS family permease
LQKAIKQLSDPYDCDGNAERGTKLKKAGILLIVASCLALVTTLFMAFFTWAEYFVPSHLGSVRVITASFYVVLSIIIFELYASALGLISAGNTFKARKFSLSILGATFLLIAGLLFFTNILFDSLPYMESFFGAYSSNVGLLPFYQLFCGIPTIILVSISITILVMKRKKFDSQEINPFLALKSILILCLIISVFSALSSIVPYVQAINQSNELASRYPLYNITVNISIFAFMVIALTFLIRKKYLVVTTALIFFSLLSALSIPFIFNTIFPWIGSFVKGLVTESPIIILLVVALALALIGQLKRNSSKS